MLQVSSSIRYYFITALLTVAASAFAQNQNCACYIQGYVLDQQSQQPIQGASIEIKELQKGTYTNEKGYYQITNLCQGKYTLRCKILGYHAIENKINLIHEATQHFDLHEEVQHLTNIEIKAKKLEELTQTKNTLTGYDLDKNQGKTVAELLSGLSGVALLQTGSNIAKPVIHGMHSNRVLILNNEIRQEGQQWGSEHAPEIDPFLAQKVTLIKGAMAVRYGADAIAGVIKIEPAPMPDSSGIHGQLNQMYFSNGRQFITSGIAQNGFSLAKNKVKAAIRLQGTIKNGGNIHSPSYNLANTGISEQNFSVTNSWKLPNLYTELFFSQFNSKIGIFSGSHIGNTTDLLTAIKTSQPASQYTPSVFGRSIEAPMQNISHNLFKTKTIYKPNLNKYELTLGRQYNYRSELDLLRGSRNLEQRFNLYTYTAELSVEHQPIAQKLTGIVGINTSIQQNLSTGQLSKPTSATVLIPNYSSSNSGIFIIEKLVKPKWDTELGLRLHYRNLHSYRIPKGSQNIEARNQSNSILSSSIGSNYHGKYWKINAQIANAWRAPSPNELYSYGVHHGTASFEQGNSNLKIEKALNTSITANYILSHWAGELHFYNNAIQNYIYLAPTGRAILSIRGAFPEYWYVQNNANFRGFDLSNNWHLSANFHIKSTYSYLKASNQKTKQALPLIPANKLQNNIEYEYKTWKIDAEWLFVAEQKRIPNTLIITDIPESEIIFKKFGGDFAPPPPAYHSFKASIHKSITFQQHSLNLGIQASNIFNNAYRDFMNRQRYFTLAQGRNILFSLQYKF
jgi:iron complex outermembrane recepter protein